LTKALRLAKPESTFEDAKGMLNNPTVSFDFVVAPLLI
jgi:hypothetical protein